MAKAPAKKTAAKTPAKKAAKPRKAVSATPEAGADEAAVAKKAAKPRKAAAPKAPVDTRITSMHGETRLTHHGDGADAIAALLPMIDAVNAGGKVSVTSVAHGPTGLNVHAVPAGHTAPFDTNPGVILTVGANGLMAFDHVAVGLATADAVVETVLSVMDAVRHEEGEEATPTGRGAGWYPRAVLAAETMAERLAA